MLCGRCCVMEPPMKLALRLDIFIEILPRTPVNSLSMTDASGLASCDHVALGKSKREIRRC